MPARENREASRISRLGSLLLRVTRRTVSLLVSAVIVLLLMVGISMGWRGFRADLLSEQVDTVLTFWEQTGRVGSQEEWQFAMDLLTKARALRDTPDYLHMQALLDEWRLFIVDTPVTSMDTDIAYRKEAIDSYRRALLLRPTWPETWAQIARLKAYLREFDEDFYEALRQALVKGQWEQRVQILMIDILGLSWFGLDEDSQVRDELLGNVQSTLGNSRASHAGMGITILRNYQMMSTICSELDLTVVAESVQNSCAREEEERLAKVAAFEEMLQQLINPEAILENLAQ